MAVAASVFTLAAMSVDRWLSISPEPRLRPPGRRQAMLLLILVWLAALLIFLPLLTVATVQKESVPVITAASLSKNMVRYFLHMLLLISLSGLLAGAMTPKRWPARRRGGGCMTRAGDRVLWQSRSYFYSSKIYYASLIPAHVYE